MEIAATVMFMNANQWRNSLPGSGRAEGLIYGSHFPQGKPLYGFEAGKLANPAGIYYLSQACFLNCEPRCHMMQASSTLSATGGITSLRSPCPGSFAYGDSMEALAHFNAQCSGRVQRLYGYIVKLVFAFSMLHGDGSKDCSSLLQINDSAVERQ